MEFDYCHLPGSVLMPLDELLRRAAEIRAEGPVVLICHHGVRSAQAWPTCSSARAARTCRACAVAWPPGPTAWTRTFRATNLSRQSSGSNVCYSYHVSTRYVRLSLPTPTPPTLADRLALRERPAGRAPDASGVGRFTVYALAGAGGAAPAAPAAPAPGRYLRRHGVAGGGAFRMSRVRTRFSPPVRGASEFLELNVRTYVHLDGVPGVWFFSLDAANPLAVWLARTFFHLPYLRATMRLDLLSPTQRQFTTQRTHTGAPPASFRATWETGAPLPPAEPGSLAFFLTERYCLDTSNAARTKLYRGRVAHAPWPLHAAELLHLETDLLEGHGFPTPAGAPVLHAGGPVSVGCGPCGGCRILGVGTYI